MAKTNCRARILALEPGEDTTLRGCKVSVVRVTVSVISRDFNRIYTVSAPKGAPIVVSRLR
jgi:hypothetical protein